MPHCAETISSVGTISCLSLHARNVPCGVWPVSLGFMTSSEWNFDISGVSAGTGVPHPSTLRAYRQDAMTLAVVTPLEAYASTVPSMANHHDLALAAEKAGFAQLWVRDVPVVDPTFADAGQVLDSFTYLGYLAATTRTIALGVAAAVLPIHHPIDVAKAAASVDQLSGGRFMLGVASGDRAAEFPAFHKDHEHRGRDFRDAFSVIRRLHGESTPEIYSQFGTLDGTLDVLPKPVGSHLPMMVVGASRQTLKWIAGNADGWMYYTLPFAQQSENLSAWRKATAPRGELGAKPFHQYTYIDLADDPLEAPTEIEQGLRVGREPLLAVLDEWQSIGVDQLILNFRRSQRPVSEVIEEFAQYICPEFPAGPGPGGTGPS